jgi:hypothetical protein
MKFLMKNTIQWRKITFALGAHKGNFQNDKNGHYPESEIHFSGMYTCQNSSNSASKTCALPTM